MADKNKVNQVVERFPALADCTSMVEFVLDIREAFKLEKVPFQLKVGTWSSGSLDKYYASVEAKRVEERFKNKRKKKSSGKGSAGWMRY